jgi:hypothetical protein
VLVARDIATGTRVLAMRRTVDPPMNTPLPALPNPITITMPASGSAKPEAPRPEPKP